MSGTRSSSRIKNMLDKKSSDHSNTSTARTNRSQTQRRTNASRSSGPAKTQRKNALKASKSKAPANKRRKVASPSQANEAPQVPRPRRRKGKLQAITDMPLDILYEIFKQCDPADLLHLSQANKALRATLLRKGSNWIWAFSFKGYRTAIPPCPDGRLILPQYANYLFGAICLACGSAASRHHLDLNIDKLCHECFLKEYIILRNWGRVEPFLSLRPSGYPGLGGRVALPGVKEKSFVARRDEYREIEANVLRLRHEDPAKLKIYIKNLAAKVRKMRQFQDDVFRFRVSEGNLDRAHAHDIRVERRRFITEKLKEKGYEDDMRELASWRPRYLDRYTERKTPITERGWKAMEENVEEYINELIKLRRKELAVSVFQSRVPDLQVLLYNWYAQPETVLLPKWWEIAAKEPVSTLLMQGLDKLSKAEAEELLKKEALARKGALAKQEADVTKSILAPLTRSKLVQLAQECSDELAAYLRSLLGGIPKGKGKHDRLFLATTYFKCFRCREPMPYPRIAVHHCLRICKAETETDEADTAITISSMLRAMGFGPPFYHGGDQVTFDEEASEHAKVLVRACGKDPKTTTFADMEALDARLECVACKPKKMREAMRWRSALLHSLKLHYATEDEPISARWHVIEDTDELQRISDAEIKAEVKDKSIKCGAYGSILESDSEDAWHVSLSKQDITYAVDSSMANFPAFVRF